ncbi:MAG: hypothetical protein ACI8S6_004903 [Myxococcota bacterium]|jgi:hypothetical protein
MNIFLIPYTWPRHLIMGLWCGAAGLLAWWAVLSFTVMIGPWWGPSWDGPLLMGAISTAVAGASVLGEGNLRRRRLLSRVWRLVLVLAAAMGFTVLWYWLWHLFSLRLIVWQLPTSEADASDSSLVSLSYRIGAFAMCGMSTGMAAMLGRGIGGWKGMINQLGGGLAAGLAAGGAWHIFNYAVFTDLYLAGAAMGFVWGASFGLLSWGIPDDLYAGWLRVVSYSRYGFRVPIDASELGPKERFVGHFPRGLDLFLPASDGVMEMHISVAVDQKQRYLLRGLSLKPTLLRRFLERIDLRYDARRPAPLETRLRSGDRVRIGDGTKSAEVEFLMLPREER